VKKKQEGWNNGKMAKQETKWNDRKFPKENGTSRGNFKGGPGRS
jgi:hypothetical protein